MNRLDEFSLIRLLTEAQRLPNMQANKGIAVGIGDDAAVVNISRGFQTVLSCDTMVEEVHFNSCTMRDADVGFKALASNISDMAAMGANPKFALVAISVPSRYSAERLVEVYKGLYECAALYDVCVIGGDTTSAPQHFTITVTIIGEVESGQALLRSTAKPGDAVFVTGYPGCSAAGLHYLIENEPPSNAAGSGISPESVRLLVQAHRRPLPSVRTGRMLLRMGECHALNDISDGLASEAWEIAEASRVGIIIDEAAVPIHPQLKSYSQIIGKDPMDWILYGGEDYHLVGTLPMDKVPSAQTMFQEEQIPFHIIGKVTSNPAGVTLKKKDGKSIPIEKKGYNHFS